MTHEFDKPYWESHWADVAMGGDRSRPVSPHLLSETTHLPAGTALDAGCGTGSEALWLAEHGWRVTGADISATALAAAASRASAAGLDGSVEWIETDVARWEPGRRWDLVVTSYAHPDTGQLAFYRHVASWVAPGGTLLIVGHARGRGHAHGSDHPESATATQAEITRLFTAPGWRIEASYEKSRIMRAGGRPTRLHDVIVRARRAR